MKEEGVPDVVAEREEKEKVVDVPSEKEMSESKVLEEAPKSRVGDEVPEAKEESPKEKEEAPKAKEEAEEEPMVQLEQSLYLKVGVNNCVHV